MSIVWHPDAGHAPAHKNGPELHDLPNKAIWMSSGDDPEHVSALLCAQRQNNRFSQPHFVWNPMTGELMQMIPVSHGNRCYPSTHPGSAAIAVLVVCPQDTVFTDYACPNLHRLTGYLKSLGVDDDWPYGPPHHGQQRTAKLILSGHYAASTIAGSTYGGPGPIDTERLKHE